MIAPRLGSWLGIGLLMLCACGRWRAPGPSPAFDALAPRALAAPRLPQPACETSACWVELADAAQREGILDVAAAYRARAKVLEPEDRLGVDTAEQPAALARRGDQLWREGNYVGAREAWSRARIQLDKRGARLRLVPTDRGPIEQLLWLGDQLGVVTTRRSIDHHQQLSVTELRGLTMDARQSERAPLLLDGELVSLASSGEGGAQRIYALSTRELAIYELASTRRVATLPITGEPGMSLRILGEGEGAPLLTQTDRKLELWSASGELQDRYELGMSPQARRDSLDRRISDRRLDLDVTPHWDAVMSASSDLRWVVLGGPDVRIELIDRKTGKQRQLVLGRDAEGQPEPHQVVALHLSKRELLAVYRNGDLGRWRLADGKLLGRISGACSFEESGELAEQARDQCGRAHRAIVSPDGRLVATVSDATLRVRATADGAPLGRQLLQEREALSAELWSFDTSGQLAVVSAGRPPQIWSQHEGLRSPWGTAVADLRPRAPVLSSDGRALRFHRSSSDFAWVLWDIAARRERALLVAEQDTLVAVADDLSRIAVATAAGLEFRRSDGSSERLVVRGVSKQVRLLGTHGQLVMLERLSGIMPVYELERGVELPLSLKAAMGSGSVSVSGDGSRLAGPGRHGGMDVFDTRSGSRLAHWPRAPMRAQLLSDDGKWLAWVEEIEESEDRGILRVASVDSGFADSEARVMGDDWPRLVAIAPNGRELWIAVGHTYSRLSLEHDTLVEEPAVQACDRLGYARDGRHMLLEYVDRVELRANIPGVPLAATVLPLPDREWLAISPAGAVDGSPGAQAHLLTVVDGPGDRFVHGASLGWDRFAVPGLTHELLAGAEVAPPMPAGAAVVRDFDQL